MPQNAFSPNNDGINDTFIVTGYGRSLDFLSELIIADRYGNIVFDIKNSQHAGWQGMYLDQPASEGIYYYITTAILIN